VTASDFLIECMDNIDDVEDAMIIRRHKDGAITFSSASKSRFNTYAMCSAVKATIEAAITVSEFQE
jgi:hypothetical protein